MYWSEYEIKSRMTDRFYNSFKYTTDKVEKHLLEEKLLTRDCFGLVGELGEVIDHIKKYIYQSHDLNKDEIKKELGDMLWYLRSLLDTLNLDFGDILDTNIRKLSIRYKHGFNIDDSINRKDTHEQE